MPATTTLIYDMQTIEDVQRIDGSVRITLGSGAMVHLATDHPHFGVIVAHAESPTRKRYPVGMVVDAGGWVVD